MNSSSKATRRRWGATLGAGFLVVVGILFWWPSEPTYQGKELSQWLEDLDYSLPGYKAENRKPAEEAILQMGPSAVPYLKAMLRSQDTSWRRFCLTNHAQLKRIGFAEPVRLNRIHWRGAYGAALLGPQAYEVADDVVPLLQDKSSWVRGRALYTLDRIGLEDAQMLRLLKQALHDPSDDTVSIACGLLYNRMPLVSLAISDLNELLHRKSSQTRSLALDLLMKVQPSNAALKPFILKLLTDRDASTRIQAALQLLKLDVDSAEKKREIAPLSVDRDVAVRYQATNILKILSGEISAKDAESMDLNGIVNVTLPTSLEYYKHYTHKKIEVIADLRTKTHLTISVIAHGIPEEDAAKLIEIAWSDQAGLMVETLEDGNVRIYDRSQRP